MLYPFSRLWLARPRSAALKVCLRTATRRGVAVFFWWEFVLSTGLADGAIDLTTLLLLEDVASSLPRITSRRMYFSTSAVFGAATPSCTT